MSSKKVVPFGSGDFSWKDSKFAKSEYSTHPSNQESRNSYDTRSSYNPNSIPNSRAVRPISFNSSEPPGNAFPMVIEIRAPTVYYPDGVQSDQGSIILRSQNSGQLTYPPEAMTHSPHPPFMNQSSSYRPDSGANRRDVTTSNSFSGYSRRN